MKYLVKKFLILISMAIMASCAAATTNNTPSNNGGPVYTIVNPGFESGLTGWAEFKAGAVSGVVYLTNNTNNSSMAAYLWGTNNGSTDVIGLMQYVSYITNKTYVLSADLQDLPGCYKYMIIEFCDTNSNQLSPPLTNYFKDSYWSGWTNVILVLAPTNIPGFIKVFFKIDVFNGTGDLYVDNVVLTNY